jgi:hypothetical protein
MEYLATTQKAVTSGIVAIATVMDSFNIRIPPIFAKLPWHQEGGCSTLLVSHKHGSGHIVRMSVESLLMRFHWWRLDGRPDPPMP